MLTKLLPNCQISEHIHKVISEKVASGELEDASVTISQLSSGSKESKPGKLRLMEEAGKSGQTEERDKGIYGK